MRALKTFNLVVAFIATTAPLAHVLEMFSKLTLDGPLWLDIQQHLYRGWGDVFGPVEIAAFLSSAALVVILRGRPSERHVYLIATACYAAMLAVFFIFNAPVNAALNQWTATTLPADWSADRLQWEVGHALTALLSMIAYVVLIRHRIHEAARPVHG